MNEIRELPPETREDAPAKAERLIEIVIRVCEQHGFPRTGKTSPTDEPTAKR
jgi:hypothetical protein